MREIQWNKVEEEEEKAAADEEERITTRTNKTAQKLSTFISHISSNHAPATPFLSFILKSKIIPLKS